MPKKLKRLVTHKELDSIVNNSELAKGNRIIPIYDLMIYVYYRIGTSPLETGRVGYLNIRDIKGIIEIDKGIRILLSFKYGEWLEKAIYEGISEFKPIAMKKEDWVNAVWTGDDEMLPDTRYKLNKTEKGHIKQMLYDWLNYQGNYNLLKEESKLKGEYW